MDLLKDKLALITGRADMPHNPPPPGHGLSDLNRRRTRGGPHPTNPRHRRILPSPISALATHSTTTSPQVTALPPSEMARCDPTQEGIIAGWVAIQTEHFRNLFLRQAAGLLAPVHMGRRIDRDRRGLPALRARARALGRHLHRRGPKRQLSSRVGRRRPPWRRLATLRNPRVTRPLHGSRCQAAQAAIAGSRLSAGWGRIKPSPRGRPGLT